LSRPKMVSEAQDQENHMELLTLGELGEVCDVQQIHLSENLTGCERCYASVLSRIILGKTGY
jgi:hypothetical protein